MARRSFTFTWDSEKCPEWEEFYQTHRPRDDGEKEINRSKLTRWMRRELTALVKVLNNGSIVSVSVEPEKNQTSQGNKPTQGEINALRWSKIE